MFSNKSSTVLFSLALLACVQIALGVASAQNRDGTEQKKLRALIITGQHSSSHAWRDTTPELRKALEETERFDVRVMEEFRGVSSVTLAPYDVLILNYSNGSDQQLAWGTETQDAVQAFVRSGKGLVLYHAALSAFRDWPAYEEMSGGSYRPNNGHHSPAHSFVIDIVDPDHPITRGLGPLQEDNDELYANLIWQPEGSYHVLATAYDDHSLYGDSPRQPVLGAGRDQPMLWTTDYGDGRVFVTAFGHGVENVRGQAFRLTFGRGAEWAATGDVVQSTK
jgi:type 1 glutamine amidotransferase